jgi:hypothetical protein
MPTSISMARKNPKNKVASEKARFFLWVELQLNALVFIN